MCAQCGLLVKILLKKLEYFRKHWCCLQTTELIRHNLKLSDADYVVLDWKLLSWFWPTSPIFRYTCIYSPVSVTIFIPLSYNLTAYIPAVIFLTSWTGFHSCTQLMTPIQTDGQFLGSCGCLDYCNSSQPLHCLWLEFVKLQVLVLDRLYWYSWHCRL